jgi:hypothetical protein
MDWFDILFAILEFLFEVMIEVLAGEASEFGFNWFFKGLSEEFGTFEQKYPWIALLAFLLTGAGLGALSLFVLPHHLMRSTRFHGISLFLSPLATGYVMSLIGRKLERGGQTSHFAKFRYGFAFALGMALIRFLFAE